ncbi:hypothetical protein GGH12_005394 [Coemansia sp. RSA 1822]|nr:hypothetical protein LPJ76_005376 [Coemansia sp. RSA 638]KAJ2539358.1 hypothetical protein GGF49_005267 [Coemansia sp. RSA 1853]KAJ2559432.1 hypothetical protein GGH12_005394 [Coemansia sp. RSA 1822]
MPLSDRIRKLAQKFATPHEAHGSGSSRVGLETGRASQTESEPSMALGEAWSVSDAQKIMAGRVGANSYKVNTRLLDAKLATAPIPTNAWWQNLIVESGDQPIVMGPYMIKSVNESLVVCAPTAMHANTFVASAWHDDWRMDMTGSTRRVVAYDSVSVTVRYEGSVLANVPLVKGAVFATIVLEAPTVIQLSTIHAIIGVCAGDAPGSTIVQLNNGSTWLMWCESNVVLRQCGMSGLESSIPMQGAVRLALVANGASAISALLSARTAIPIGGDVSINATNETAEFSIAWKVRGSGDLLMCAQPHHQHVLNAEWMDDVGSYWSSKGTLRVARGTKWQWCEPIEPLGFAGQTELCAQHKEKLRELVAIDACALADSVLPPDPYFFGKALARAARIALIADEVDDPHSRDMAVQQVAEWFEPWLNGSNSNPLVYDTEWFGIVSSSGLCDAHADFGQGRYNDHHFHYGYFVYAAAVLAKLYPEWATCHRDALDIFARDYCNLNTKDTSFTLLRCFDIYEGNSWAAGLFPFADSRNQESTSEAINAYYAAYLYALATRRPQIAHVIRGVLQLEARTARTYWHVDDICNVYPHEYSCDKAVVGILWSSKADYATFFGNNPEYIYGIQFLPYTPATALLIKRAWIEKIWAPYLQRVADNAQTDAWREIIDLTYAVVDKNATLDRIARISSHDDGNSASNAYYWVATAPEP